MTAIDAPIPECEVVTAEVVWVSQDYAKQVITINQQLRAETARLEAEKQEARTALKRISDGANLLINVSENRDCSATVLQCGLSN